MIVPQHPRKLWEVCTCRRVTSSIWYERKCSAHNRVLVEIVVGASSNGVELHEVVKVADLSGSPFLRGGEKRYSKTQSGLAGLSQTAVTYISQSCSVEKL